MIVSQDDRMKYALAGMWARAVTDRALIQASGLETISAGQALLVEAISLMTSRDLAWCQAASIAMCDLLIARQGAEQISQDNGSAP
jgi:hypothetical protein